MALPAFAALLTTPFLIAASSDRQLSEVSALLTIISAAVLLDLGMGKLLVQVATSAKHMLGASVISSILLCGLTGSLIAVVVTFLWKLTFPGTSVVTFVSAAILGPLTLTQIPLRASLEGLGKFRETATLTAIGGSLNFALPAAIITSGGDITTVAWALATKQLLAVVILAVLLFTKLSSIAVNDSRGVAFTELMKFIRWMGPASIAATILTLGDRGVAALALDHTQLGPYIIIADLSIKTMLLSAAISIVAFQRLSRSAGRGSGTVAIVSNLLTTPPYLIAILYSSELLELWTSPAFAAENYQTLAIFLAGAMIASTGAPFLQSALISHGPKVISRCYLWELAFFSLLLAIAASAASPAALASAWTARCACDTIALASINNHNASGRSRILIPSLSISQAVATLTALTLGDPLLRLLTFIILLTLHILTSLSLLRGEGRHTT